MVPPLYEVTDPALPYLLAPGLTCSFSVLMGVGTAGVLNVTPKAWAMAAAADWPPCSLSCNPPVTLWTTEFLKVQILYILKFLLFPNTNFAILWPLLVQDSVTIFLTSPHFCSKESIEVVKQLRLQENRSVSSHLCPVRTTMPGRCTAGRRQLDC